MRRDVYSGWASLKGEEYFDTLREAGNYALSLLRLGRFREVRSLLRKVIPVARRVLGDSHRTTLTMRWIYAENLYINDRATLDDLREAVTTLEDVERTARRVLGGNHPFTMGTEDRMRIVRAALRARETPQEV